MKYKIKYQSISLNDSFGDPLTSPDSIPKMFDYGKDFSPGQESVYLLVIDTSGKTVLKRELVKGEPSKCTLGFPLIFQNVLWTGSHKFFIVHNHPSDSTVPSEEDMVFTSGLVKASKMMQMTFIDHLILTPSGEYYSFRRNGLIG